MFVVKFLHLVERTKEEFYYEHLMDALKVAKETNLGSDRTYCEAIPNKVFDECLLILLTSGFLYVGRKTEEYPDGNMMVMLLKHDPETRSEAVVYNNLPFAIPPLVKG